MTKKIVVRINDLLKKKNFTFEQLSVITGVRAAALNELSNGKRKRIEFAHIERIANALHISDIRQIIDLVDKENEENES